MIKDFYGWVDDESIRSEMFHILPDRCQKPFRIKGAIKPSRRMFLFEVVRQINKKDLINIPQQSEDCVSRSAKHALEYLQYCQIALGNRSVFKYIFSPYLHGCGRVFIGNNWLGKKGGSMGVWQAMACLRYGAIPEDTGGLPPYSDEVAQLFGSSAITLNKYVPIGKEHLVGSVAKITNWDDLVESVVNMHPVTVAFREGFTEQTQRDGFNQKKGHWQHQTCIIGVDDDGGDVEPHVCMLNSFGDVHGRITDFRNPSLKWPVGTLRIRKSDMENILTQDDNWAYSAFKDFPTQELPEDFFDTLC